MERNAAIVRGKNVNAMASVLSVWNTTKKKDTRLIASG